MKPPFLFAKILTTGGIVLGLELAASRVMTPFFGVSLYVWSAVLSVTLIALALGYKAGGILAARLGHDGTMLFFAAAAGLAAVWMNITAWTYPFLFAPLAAADLVLGSIVACLYMLLVPLVILSALNPALVALLRDRDGADHGAGNVFFVSTVGSVLGIFVVGLAKALRRQRRQHPDTQRQPTPKPRPQYVAAAQAGVVVRGGILAGLVHTDHGLLLLSLIITHVNYRELLAAAARTVKSRALTP